MMALSKQRKFTFNSLLEDIRGSKCCVIKVRQYIIYSKNKVKFPTNCQNISCSILLQFGTTNKLADFLEGLKS